MNCVEAIRIIEARRKAMRVWQTTLSERAGYNRKTWMQVVKREGCTAHVLFDHAQALGFDFQLVDCREFYSNSSQENRR